MNLSEVLILDKEILYAHNKEGHNRETLQEHTSLCEKYWKKIEKEKEITCVWERFLDTYMPKFTLEAKQLAIALLDSIPTFHDIGKMNPEYQRKKMNHRNFLFSKPECLEGANHSLLSSIVYIDYWFGKLEEASLKKTEKRKLRVIVYCAAYVISRHHSGLETMEEFKSWFAGKEDDCEENNNGKNDICDINFGYGKATLIVAAMLSKQFPLYKGPFFLTETTVAFVQAAHNTMKKEKRDKQIALITITRLLYSLLAASDFYAVHEYDTGDEKRDLGAFEKKEEMIAAYESGERIQNIRIYAQEKWKKAGNEKPDINSLRNELFLEAEKAWKEQKQQNIFFLEAPTGSGKSNTALNLSFQMLKDGQKKLFYVYPFNTLVEQNLITLEEIYNGRKDILRNISVINSVTPIKVKSTEEEDGEEYKNALLDRQFLNDSILLTTHVSLFDTLFSNIREKIFGFYQLIGSVIVLDEIQSYKNKIWAEIIIFLKEMAKLLGMKIIIMSATLPDLECLSGEEGRVLKLVANREKYFNNPIFNQRVRLNFELLESPFCMERLLEHIVEYTTEKEGVLIEFIKKDSAYKCYRFLSEAQIEGRKIRLLTGDDNQNERRKLLKEIKKNRAGIILAATQTVEAGLDIDMDVGYKDISKLDSEEQFLGRINRSSCRDNGVVYFFDLDEENKIYKEDIRICPEYTLKTQEMQKILEQKNFQLYYRLIMKQLQKKFNHSTDTEGLDSFFDKVGEGNFKAIAERMQLIKEDERKISVLFARCIELENGVVLDGWECWKRYRSLLEDTKMDYEKRQVLLSKVRAEMSYFIYEIKTDSALVYSDRLGNLYAIENGEEYFKEGKLDKEKFEKMGGILIDI